MNRPHYPTFAALLALASVCLCTLPAAAHPTALTLSKSARIHAVHHSRPASRHAYAVSHPAKSQHRSSRLVAIRPPHRKAPHAHLLIASRHPAKASLTGIAQPPDRNDTTIPAPVISIIRRTSERPQLPSIEQVAATPAILPSLYDKRGRLVMPPAMKGSHEILLHQNEVADHDGLERIQDDDAIESMRHRAMLVALPISSGMQVDDRLPPNRRYCRPWAAQFLATLARAHYDRFHTPLQVNSAVRTIAFQQRLIRTNGNAAPAAGETASPHLTGQAVDLAKRGLSLNEIAWMRGYLLPLVSEGKIDVEEEFQQSCFHISVYKKYLAPAPALRRNIASTQSDSPAALAITIP